MKRIVFVVVCLVASLALFGLELNPKFDSDSVAGYQQKADAGDTEAAFLFSDALANGYCIKKDKSKAMKYAQQAADGGFELAWRRVGLGYEKGWGGETNVLKAAECYTKFLKYAKPKAEDGDSWSQCLIGLCYDSGNGVEKDAVQAVKWYRKAADQGHAGAQHNLGTCYYDGTGVEKDAAQAVKWYRKAADQGLARAQCRLGFCYYDGTGMEKDAAEAVKWFDKAAEQGLATAQYLLGLCYFHGTGVKKDRVIGLICWQKAAGQGDVFAQYNLGCCYLRGEGVNKDMPEAVKWFRKAAEQGHAKAQHNLGICYEIGNGVKKDAAEAKKWFQKAVEQGYKKSQEKLGKLVEDEKKFIIKSEFNGIFGKKFGETVPVRQSQMVRKEGMDFYRVTFSPQRKSTAFDEYYVWCTAKSHRIFAIEARSDTSLPGAPRPELVLSLGRKYQCQFEEKGEGFIAYSCNPEGRSLFIVPDIIRTIENRRDAGEFATALLGNLQSFESGLDEISKFEKLKNKYRFKYGDFDNDKSTRAIALARDEKLFKEAQRESGQYRQDGADAF